MTRSFVLASLFALAAAPTLADCMPHKVEAAHGGEIWNGKQAFEAQIVVEFGGNKLIDGRMLTDTAVGKARFELRDGTVLVFDGADAWKAPAGAPFERTRFHVLTWPYFLAAPMKLDDPGTRWEDLGRLPYGGGRELPAGRLTFGDGVGDSPDDWYIVYTHPQSHRLEAMAYIVTFGTSVEEAESKPHAVVYDRYEEVDGVQLATRWRFFGWDEATGVKSEQIGEVMLSYLRFVEPAADAVTAPEGAEKVPGPPR